MNRVVLRDKEDDKAVDPGRMDECESSIESNKGFLREQEHRKGKGIAGSEKQCAPSLPWGTLMFPLSSQYFCCSLQGEKCKGKVKK